MSRGNRECLAVDLVAGARPNFIKLAPVERAILAQDRLLTRIIHTGQHYDPTMNGVFFDELEIREPDVFLGVGSGTHGQQTARILERYEAHLLDGEPDGVVVFGDVNSTVACALAAIKLGVPVFHVEAGLRSFDRSIPEEINRILVDSISDLLLVSEPSGVANLEKEGVDASKVHLVGNVMIDSLSTAVARLDDSILDDQGVKPGEYGLVTMHRPSNVDDPSTLGSLLELFGDLAKQLRMVFPVHPRTRMAAERAGLLNLLDETPGLTTLPPLAYGDSLSLMRKARLVVTDSGGIQEETSFLRVPCVTLRDNTERPVTVTRGTNALVGNDGEKIRSAFDKIMKGDWPAGEDISLWDGRAAFRIASVIADWLEA
jgi:UDP-N-acetylglucosamine 2-epimerase (non-hydrolysing)